ncbi:protein SRG1-like [Mangifera indica]|uniref:protein SRG1-like n=1 Tax=Mangifera indica TaxID=29780 RepID=UPI001CFA0A8E|nr:protein SRG1-like [Mangifera indica]
MKMASSQPHIENCEFSMASLQELIKDPNITVPNNYYRPDQEPLKLLNGNDNFPATPTIDLERLVSKEHTELELEKLEATCKEWGIFQLVNHGVSSSLMEKLKLEIQEFCELPVEDKMKFKIKKGEFEGYGSLARSDGKLDWGDRLFMITNPVHRRKPYLFPELPSSLRNTLECYFQELQNLSKILLGMIAKNLKMEIKEMEELFEDGMQSVRLNYYPPCSEPEVVMGIVPHSDVSGITILHQVNGVDGLQIKKEGVWIPLSILPEAFVINLGDILEMISNGVYQSIEHRASINSEKERISVAFFVNPRFDAEIGPASSLISPENPPLFKKIRMEDYVTGFSSLKLNGKKYLANLKIESGEGTQHDN